ncbi:MAG: lipid A deacylase LpxR family protein [Pseudomonadota bacterium]
MSTTRLVRLLLQAGVALTCLLSLPAAHAEHVLNLVVENDTFTGTDRHYTSGVMLNYISGVEDGPRRLRNLGFRFPGMQDNDEMHVSLSLGHEIYTPTDIKVTALQEDDRPYAGYAYLAAGFSTANATEIETWRMSIGLVGPDAQGERVQNTVHNLIEEPEAQGWRHQLDNEWVFTLAYEKKWLNRAWTASERWALEADVIPHFGGAVGTAQSYAGVGAMLRLGQGLKKDLGPPKVRPSLPLSQFYDASAGNSWYFFAGIDSRFMAHNIFLDGNNFSDSHSVDKEFFVTDLQAGVVWNNPHFRVGYTYVMRSREFKGQDERDLFGSLTFSLHF